MSDTDIQKKEDPKSSFGSVLPPDQHVTLELLKEQRDKQEEEDGTWWSVRDQKIVKRQTS